MVSKWTASQDVERLAKEQSMGLGQLLEEWVYCLMTPQCLCSFSDEGIKRCIRSCIYSGRNLLFCWSGLQLHAAATMNLKHSHCPCAKWGSYSTFSASVSFVQNGVNDFMGSHYLRGNNTRERYIKQWQEHIRLSRIIAIVDIFSIVRL